MYTYFSYGLKVNTAILLPELVEYQQGFQPTKPAINITYRPVPDHIDNPLSHGVVYEANAHQFLFKLEGVGRYLVQNGNEVFIEPDDGATNSDIRTFLLGSCFGALLHQRGVLALHASAIYTPQGAVLFTGQSGIGKSTLLQAFIAQGYQMMADDVTAITYNEQGELHILPAFPRTKLWEDVATYFQHDITELPRVRAQLNKYNIHLHDRFYTQPAKLHKIYHLTSHNIDNFKLEPLPKLKRFNVLLHNTYRQQYLDGLAMRPAHFRLVQDVANTVAVKRVTRPSEPFRLTKLVDMLKEDFSRTTDEKADG